MLEEFDKFMLNLVSYEFLLQEEDELIGWH